MNNISDCIFFGDFNIPVLNSGNAVSSHATYDIYHNLLDSDVTQHVHSRTKGNHITDLILSTNECLAKLKLGAYAEAARGLGAHLRDIGPVAGRSLLHLDKYTNP